MYQFFSKIWKIILYFNKIFEMISLKKFKTESQPGHFLVLFLKFLANLSLMSLIKKTRPSRPIRCDLWIVEQMLNQQTDRPTNQLTNGQSQLKRCSVAPKNVFQMLFLWTILNKNYLQFLFEHPLQNMLKA